ncbi:MAG: hypothetical protein OXE84_06460 [Rhodobacteraceae bacterium]|nr:hypothetical protein [Paracoccaceae bacterium]MCY4197622.1 hypothetical protein [Paracoccaceae bacterium]MCY4325988.1 hypothetical protein [Paracoccaceae bacterium]
MMPQPDRYCMSPDPRQDRWRSFQESRAMKSGDGLRRRKTLQVLALRICQRDNGAQIHMV